jgi:hypothetical protein
MRAITDDIAGVVHQLQAMSHVHNKGRIPLTHPDSPFIELRIVRNHIVEGQNTTGKHRRLCIPHGGPSVMPEIPGLRSVPIVGTFETQSDAACQACP